MTDRLDQCVADGRNCTSDPRPDDHAPRPPTSRSTSRPTRQPTSLSSSGGPVAAGLRSIDSTPIDEGWGDRTPRSICSRSSRASRASSPAAMAAGPSCRRHRAHRPHPFARHPATQAAGRRPLQTAPEATLGELAAGWIDDDDWPELDDLGPAHAAQRHDRAAARPSHVRRAACARSPSTRRRVRRLPRGSRRGRRCSLSHRTRPSGVQAGAGCRRSAARPSRRDRRGRRAAVARSRCRLAADGGLRRGWSVPSCRCRSPRRRLLRATVADTAAAAVVDR